MENIVYKNLNLDLSASLLLSLLLLGGALFGPQEVFDKK